MKHAVINYVEITPDWNNIPIVHINHQYKPVNACIDAWAQICYDDNSLHLHMWAREMDIRAEVTDPMGQTCEDSCLEFFFCPDPQDMRYFNIEMNPNGCPFIGFGSCFDDLIRLHPLTERFNQKINRKEDGWEIFYNIPFSFIKQFFPNFIPIPGKILRANFYKCGDLTKHPHYYCWSVPAQKPHGFHSPECFGILEFGEKVK